MCQAEGFYSIRDQLSPKWREFVSFAYETIQNEERLCSEVRGKIMLQATKDFYHTAEFLDLLTANGKGMGDVMGLVDDITRALDDLLSSPSIPSRSNPEEN